MKPVRIIGIRTHAQSFDSALTTLQNWAKDGQKRYVSTAPAYTLVMGERRPDVFQALESADMVTADGMPIVWLQRLAGVRHAERVYGPDLMNRLVGASQNQPLRHYFYGGLPGVPERLAESFIARYPGIIIAGTHSPDGDVLRDAPQQSTIDRINAASPDVVWVGLGSPKQDLWMRAYRGRLNAALLIGVGAAFDFLSGTKPQAPRWMQRSGLEWAYRLASEPQRLWKRYLIYNTLFLLLVIKSSLYKPRKSAE